MRSSLAKPAVAGAALLLAAAAVRKRRKFPLDGAAVFVAGGSRGLGFAIAEEYARRGARVAIFGRDETRLAGAAERLAAKGFDVATFVGDLREKADAQRAVRQAAERLGGLDILVNNAGTIAVGPMQTMTQDDYEDAMATHFWGPYFAIEAALPIFRRQGRGRIVNINSIGGKASVPHLVPYCVSKFAQSAYSQGLRAELRREGIVVTTVYPGLMRTGSPKNAWFKSQNTREYAWFSVSDALPGLSISARSAARAVVEASARGDAEVVLSLPAKLLAFVCAVFPKLASRAFTLAARLLPGPGGIGEAKARGYASTSVVSESPLGFLRKNAERRYNQD